MAVAKNHELDWLPPGWKVEDEVKNGRKVRCFINVKSSQRLYSKASVLRQIRKSRMNSQGSHSQSSSGPLTRSLRNKEIPIPTEPSDCHDSLPPGWITEVKTRKSGKRAGEDYKIYIEPSTGKMFYSKPEVTRYLKGKEQSAGSSERKKSGATVDSSIQGSVRILRRHKLDQGEEVAPHPKFDEAKRVEVAPHPKSSEAKSEEVPQHPKLDERKAKELSRDPKFDEGKKEMVPQHPKLDERKKEEVPRCRKLEEGKAEKVTQDPKFDEGKKEEVPQDPNFDEGEKSQPSKKRKGSVRVLRSRKPDQGKELAPHPKFNEGKSEEVPHHPKSDEWKTKELPRDPKFDDGKREMVPQHLKLDERKKEEVPQHPKFDEGKPEEVTQHPKSDEGKNEEVPQDPKFDEVKKSQQSKSRKGSVRVLRRHKPDQGEEVALHPKFNEGKREEVPQHPNFNEGNTKELPQDPKFDEGKREMVPLHSKLDESKRGEVLQRRKFDEGKAEEVTQHLKFDEGKGEEVPQDPKFAEGNKSQPSKKRKAIVETEIAEGLPPGWIKEIRIKESSNGVRKDPFYFNPTSGYVFRSRLEVLRYLETGEISKHAYKRRDSGRNIIQSTQESPSDSTVRSNTVEDSIKRQFFTGEKNPKRSSLPNCGYSKAGNNALLDLGADVDTNPIEVQKPKGNETVVHSGAEPTCFLKDVFLEKKHKDSNEANTLAVETKPATSPSKNEFSGVERSKDKEETGKWSTETREREPKRTMKEMDSSRRLSKRLAGIEIEHVTHSVAIERVLRSANRKSDKSEAEQSQKASLEESICHYNTESATDVFQEEQSNDREEIGKKSSERKLKRNRKKIFEGIEVDPETSPMASGRVLRSAIKMSTNNEAMPTLGSDQGEQAQEVPQATNVGSQEETVHHYTGPATVPSKNELLVVERIKDKEEIVHHYTERATVPLKNEKRSSVRKPKRNRSSKLLAGIEDEHVTHSMVKQRILQSARTEAMPSSGSEQGQQAQEAPLVINSHGKNVPAASIFPEEQTAKASSRSNNTHQSMMIDFSRNTNGGQTIVEPSRNNFTNQMFKEPPKINSKERFSTDELTNGREKELQDSPFSFPWSDPCIEFAYKTLTGALPLDDTVAIHDYVQHQIRTCSNSSNNNFAFQDSRPPGFSLNTVPSNSSNSITFPDPGPPGFSRGSVSTNRNDNFALPEARPPGFQKPSNSGNNPTFPDATPPGFSFNAAPSNRGNNLTIPDARPPGFSLNDIPSDHGNDITFSDAMPPGFSLNDIPSNSSNSIAFPDATPPGFSLNDVPASCGNNLTFPDATPPGFSLNDVPSNLGNSIAFPDSGPPGFSRSSVPSKSSDNLAIQDGTPPGFTRSSVPSNRSDTFALPEARPRGFSQSSVLSNRGNNFAIPDAKRPEISRSSVPSNSSDHYALPHTRSPSFSLNSAPSNSNDHFVLPDARQPGLSWSSAPSNINDNFALPDARPPGFSLNSAPSNINDNFALPDARPPGFSLNSAPSNSNNDHFGLPDVRQSGFSRTSVPSNSNNHFSLPDAKPPGFSRSSVPPNSNNDNFALPDARRTGFPWSSSSVPANSSNNPALPDANPPGFSWSGFPLDGGINLNVAFTDDGPPGFSEKIVPSSKQQQQQDINPAGLHAHAEDFPLQETMFSSWNRNLR